MEDIRRSLGFYRKQLRVESRPMSRLQAQTRNSTRPCDRNSVPQDGATYAPPLRSLEMRRRVYSKTCNSAKVAVGVSRSDDSRPIAANGLLIVRLSQPTESVAFDLGLESDGCRDSYQRASFLHRGSGCLSRREMKYCPFSSAARPLGKARIGRHGGSRRVPVTIVPARSPTSPGPLDRTLRASVRKV
jgi:hypothetical protein